MINIKVAGGCEYTIENIVFDYNGTIAVNGKIIPSILDKLSILSNMAEDNKFDPRYHAMINEHLMIFRNRFNRQQKYIAKNRKL